MADEVTIVVRAKDEFSSTLGNFGSIMTGIESAINLAGKALSTFSGFAMEGLDAIASYERMAASMETLAAKEILASGAAKDMNQALQMATLIAPELLEWNQKLAINSPFTAEGVNNAFRMAQAYGFTIDEAKRLTQALIDFAAGSGASEAAMEAIARALGQISATGKVTGGDMLQLVNAGLPVVEILAEGFGVTTEQLMEMRSKGLLPATEAIEYITKYLEENFAGAAARQAMTWAGLQGTFSDIKQMGLREFFGGLFEVLQPVAVELSNFLQDEGMRKLAEWGTALGASAKPIAEFFTGLMKGLAEGLPLIDSFVIALKSIGGDETPEWIVNFANGLEADLSGSIDAFISNFFGNIAEAIHDWVGSDGPDQLAGKIAEWIETAGKGPAIGAKTITAIYEIFQALRRAIQDFTDNTVIADALDERIAKALEGEDFSKSGAAFGDAVWKFIVDALTKPRSESETGFGMFGGNMIQDLIDGLKKSDAAAEIWEAIKEWFSGAFSKLTTWLNTPLNTEAQKVAMGKAVRGWFADIGKDVWEGFVDGLKSFDAAITDWAWNNIVVPIRKIFKIASPSALFFEYGRNIIEGFILGIMSMVGGILSIFQNIIDWIMALPGMSTLLDFLGFDVNSTTGGTVGTHDPGTAGTGTGASGQSVVNNFYGPVYFGDMTSLGYEECPSPHPLIAASGNGLTTSGIG